MRELLRRAGGLDVFGVKVDHVAGREGRCRGAAAVVIPCHIVLCLSQRQASSRVSFIQSVNSLTALMQDRG